MNENPDILTTIIVYAAMLYGVFWLATRFNRNARYTSKEWRDQQRSSEGNLDD